MVCFKCFNYFESSSQEFKSSSEAGWNRIIQVNVWNIMHLNCGERYEDMIDHCCWIHNLSSCEMKSLNGIRTLDLCDTSAVLYHFCSFTQKDAILLEWAIFHGLTQTAFGKRKILFPPNTLKCLLLRLLTTVFCLFETYRTRCDFHFLR